MSRTSLPYSWKPGEPVDHRRLNQMQDRSIMEIYLQPPLFGTRLGNRMTIRVEARGGGGSESELPEFQYPGMGWFNVGSGMAGAYPFMVQTV